MTVLVSHPTGNANVRAVLRGLESAGLLGEFHTTLAAPLMPGPLGSWIRGTELQRRQFDQLSWRKIRLHPSRELVRHFAPRLGLKSLTQHESGIASVDSVYHHLDRAVSRRLAKQSSRFSLVYAYEDGAEQSFEVARTKGIGSIYDLPIAHWRTLHRILNEEAEAKPDWASSLGGLDDSRKKRDRKDREIELADRIIVPSDFVRRSVAEAFPEKADTIAVIPFGSPPPILDVPAVRAAGEPIRLLFAGQLTQRKGLAYLAEALEAVEVEWHLTIAGPKPTEMPEPLAALLSHDRCTWLGRVPHDKLLSEMSRAHVFTFPSLVEGFALVIPEALSAGLPIITTPNSGADTLTEGKDGYIIPIRDPDALADRITRFAEDESKRHAMATAALETARQMSWDHYEIQIARLVTDWCGA